MSEAQSNSLVSQTHPRKPKQRDLSPGWTNQDFEPLVCVLAKHGLEDPSTRNLLEFTVLSQVNLANVYEYVPEFDRSVARCRGKVILVELGPGDIIKSVLRFIATKGS